MGCSVESCGLPRRPPILHLIVRTGVVPLVSSIVAHYSYSSSFVVRRSFFDSRFSILIVPRSYRSSFLALDLDSRFSSFRVLRFSLSTLDSRFSSFCVLIGPRLFVTSRCVAHHVFRLGSALGTWLPIHSDLLFHSLLGFIVSFALRIYSRFALGSFGLVQDCSSAFLVACL